MINGKHGGKEEEGNNIIVALETLNVYLSPLQDPTLSRRLKIQVGNLVEPVLESTPAQGILRGGGKTTCREEEGREK